VDRPKSAGSLRSPYIRSPIAVQRNALFRARYEVEAANTFPRLTIAHVSVSAFQKLNRAVKPGHAKEAARALDEETRGSVAWVAVIPSSLTYPIRVACHTAAEFAVILGSMGFTLPPELVASYPVPSDEQLGYDEIDAMTLEERSRLVF